MDRDNALKNIKLAFWTLKKMPLSTEQKILWVTVRQNELLPGVPDAERTSCKVFSCQMHFLKNEKKSCLPLSAHSTFFSWITIILHLSFLRSLTKKKRQKTVGV